MARSERGSITPLLIFFCFLGLTVICVVVAATSLYIERKRLFTVADGAALAATEQFDLAELSQEDGQLVVRLTQAEVANAAAEYLIDSTPAPAVRLLRADAPDGRSARVSIAGEWAPPILSELLPWRLTLEATATARTVFR